MEIKMAESEKKEKKEEKKIIVDDDWKQEAKKEKEILASEEEAEKEKDEHEGRGPLPPGDFAALISMLMTQALFAMGFLQIKGQENREPDLEMAKYNIDMLETLEEKTKGNLTEPEQKILTDTLNQLRMGYVKIAG
jgi:hypothetical protein